MKEPFKLLQIKEGDQYRIISLQSKNLSNRGNTRLSQEYISWNRGKTGLVIS